MASVVYLLGAGFNCSIVDPTRHLDAPLATNFFKVLLKSGRLRDRLDGIRGRLFVDLLLAEIQRFWGLTLDDLETVGFDIEECLTMFESQLSDRPGEDRELELRRASFALRNLLLMYLGELAYSGHTPAARQFGSEVLSSQADVLTFNYDTLAEEAIASSSGIGPKPLPDRCQRDPFAEVADDDLDASHLSWKPQLAYGFKFDEVSLPLAGVSQYVSGDRYYAHPANSLYAATRVLKLHGSIDWLRYTPTRLIPPEFDGRPPGPAPTGMLLERHSNFWMGESPTHDGWHMEPVVIPPQLFKHFQDGPFPLVLAHALEALSECRELIVVGYSFPPTDFRTRRLFLEAFSNHALERLVVVNPDTAVAGLVRRLTRFDGPVISCDSLSSLYGLPSSWFPAQTTGNH